MPISQSRMIALIKAGFDYKQGLETLLALIEQERERVETGETTPDQFLAIIIPSTKLHFLLTDPVQSAITLLGEEKHFRLHGRRNSNKARKIRENKAADREGLQRPQRSSTAPPRIDRAHGQQPNLLRYALRGSPGADPKLGEELELGDWSEPAALPYVPGTLSEKQKAEIEGFSAQQEAAQPFMPLPGFTIAQRICQHVLARGEGICGDCGKEITSNE